ncbi:asparagine synthetase B [Thalassobacillus devorans]|uniref:asparagine synthase (glutamine-hydrolyzing) n=1 Tax=Thalassobacillus devorans TaxID=279813 RepID=A0ABQ1NE68_9BACI|nr:asparagine synthase (glutamine-hydrolyzing) [Thalassobacillus devorans]NIK27022.1 asparagine synthase (glutamine-hydrolysing) [Thalassobacillus devorans]GGC74261.1 asparagine synthetase B [Thalassobacillus devorans]
MCGIVGWTDFNKDLSCAFDTITAMGRALEHRGPDEGNQWFGRHTAFGHQRLIVIDPKGGRQPMTRQAGEKRYTLCYNGELYNTEDVRAELASRGWSFRSHSDTEVLLTSYMQWGESCVDHLNGIFAFAVWDDAEQKLFLARDRLGVKPLFYTEVDGGLLFASEIKGLLSHPNVEAALDETGLHELLALGPSRTPGCGVFKGIYDLRPGHCAAYTKQGGLKVSRYWNVESQPHSDNLDMTVAKVRELFLDAVNRQLVSDVPLGTFLSGGVDSSAITAIAAEKYRASNKGALDTFSIDFEGNDKHFKANTFQPTSDKDFIALIQKEHSTNHYSCIADNALLVKLLKEATVFRDLPGMADVDSSLLWFCGEVKDKVTVGLSGECADEIFGGYPWFYREDEIEREGFPWIRSLDFRNNLLKKEWQQKLDLKGYMLARYQETIDEMPKLPGESAMEEKRRQMFYLNMHWFMQTLLDRKDRMSMGASLEVRVPFSDHHLVEYVWNVPWEMKHLDGKEKGLLRKALEGILPDEVLYRKKNPYPKTHNPLYTESVVKWMNEIIADKQAPVFDLFERTKLKQLADSKGKAVDVPWFGQLMTGPQLLAHLCQVNYWLEHYKVSIKK